MIDWYTLADRFYWSPESLDDLDLLDLFQHADVVRALIEKEAKASRRRR